MQTFAFCLNFPPFVLAMVDDERQKIKQLFEIGFMFVLENRTKQCTAKKYDKRYKII